MRSRFPWFNCLTRFERKKTVFEGVSEVKVLGLIVHAIILIFVYRFVVSKGLAEKKQFTV